MIPYIFLLLLSEHGCEYPVIVSNEHKYYIKSN